MPSKRSPKVSILIPIKNEEQYLHTAIESILSQTYKNIELVIVDDGSDDASLSIARKFEQQHPDILVLINPRPGKVRAFNLAYENASGDFFMFFAGDDILPQNAVEIRVRPLLNIEKGRIGISSSKLKMFSKIKKFDGVVAPRDPAKGNYSGGTIMFNREFAQIIFPIPEVLGNEDQWCYLHIQRHEELVSHVLEVGILYRIHEHNSSSRTDPFSKKTHSRHHRSIAYSVFLERYRQQLSENELRYLSALAAAETLRYSGNWLSILFMSGLTLAGKARAIMYSNAFFNWLRIQFFSFFSGWGY